MSPVYSEFIEQESGPGSRLMSIVRRIGLGLLALVVLVAAALLFLEIENQLDRSRVAQSDNTTWVLSQFEVDLLNFQHSLHVAVDEMGGPGQPDSLAQVRLRYDILFSRIDILNSSPEVATLPIATSEIWKRTNGPKGLVAVATPLIDSPDDVLAKAVPDLERMVDAIREPARRIIVSSLARRMEIGNEWRNDLRSALQFFAAASIGLLGILSAMMVTIYLQSRAQQRHALMLESAVHNLRTTVNTSVNPVIVVNYQGQILGWNKAGVELFGLSDEDQNSRLFGTLVRSAPDEIPLLDICHAILDGTFSEKIGDRRLRMIGQSATGQDIPCEMNLAEARGLNGEPQIIAFIRDISEQINRETVLTEARNSALRGEEAKARFLAVMSHEMRTPLNGLLSATDLLMRTTKLDERQSWLGGIIHSCGRATLDQVNNVLELTRLGAADGPGYTPATFSVIDTIRELILHSQPDAIVRGNTLVLADPVPEIPPVFGARQLFHRIINNLLSNAIKFTEGGRITVLVDVESGAEPDSFAIRVSVTDTGIGIHEQDLERIFHNFETLDSSYARMQQGSGLGLGIAKLSAEALGGRVTVESRLGQGSTFSLFVTFTRAKITPAEVTALPINRMPGRGLSVLVVEDNALNRHLLTELLRLHNHSVTAAEDGVEAVEIASATRFDVILMDVSMPRMDGLEATRRIRSGGASANVPILAVTANSDPDKMTDFLASGMNDVMTKPIDISALDAAIRRHVPAGAQPIPPRQVWSAPPRQTETVVEMPVQQTANPVVLPVAAMPLAGQDASGLLDEETMADLEEQLGRDFIASMTKRFVTEADEAMGQLATTEAAGDLPKAAQVAHKAAGAAAALGLKGLHRVLVNFENEAKAGEVSQMRARLARIEEIKQDTYALLKERGLIA